MSKGIGGVGFPISAVLYKKSIEAWGPGDHVGTFRGNQVSLAACNGAMDFIKKFPLKEHVSRMSDVLLKGLRELAQTYNAIGDVREKGLMIGIEFVKDRVRKTAYPEFATKFKQNCFQRGLIFEIGGHFSNVARILPPLVITETMIAKGLSLMKEALDTTMGELAIER
jgi:diaminobutyrate-2-oxoglutarate transaminase